MKFIAVVAAALWLTSTGIMPAVAQTPHPIGKFTQRPPGPGDYPGGSWTHTCEYGRFEYYEQFYASCREPSGRMNPTHIDPSTCHQRLLKNRDGRLACEL